MFADDNDQTKTESRFIQPLVYGGKKTSIYDAPYMGLVYDVKIGFYCGATIVGKKFLLTAAHCYNPKSKYYIKVGTDSLDGGKRYEIETIVPHPGYDADAGNNDVAVIKLKRDLKFNRRVRPIRMAPKDIKLTSGDMMTTMGFGATELDSISHYLLRVDVPYVSNADCASILSSITTSMICAGGEKGKDACHGDSGGPLIYGDMIVGIVSFGVGCGEQWPGVYASVPALRDFIDQTISQLSTPSIKRFYSPW
ncbi:trypsin 3A1-like [Vanessa cardui]|uniref:trypsin 3A1-like n=1 Tax=Vanessa cardui TaxID=171605 RepID=UPI001F13E648|nr:trypsin 3A1-like [Vanessa cardui]